MTKAFCLFEFMYHISKVQEENTFNVLEVYNEL